MGEAQLFKEINVWRRLDDDQLVCYRCLQLLPANRFVVKSSHFYHYPISLDDKQLKLAAFYFLDGMFGDALLEILAETYETIEEAIAKHETDFS